MVIGGWKVRSEERVFRTGSAVLSERRVVMGTSLSRASSRVTQKHGLLSLQWLGYSPFSKMNHCKVHFSTVLSMNL